YKQRGHIKCLHINDPLYESFKNSDHPFYCNFYIPLVKQFLKIEKRLDSFEHTNLESNNNSSTNSSRDIAMLIKDALEIESKKNNAVLFGLPKLTAWMILMLLQQFIGNHDENSTSILNNNVV
uniref:Uncharacterized protein n=1 Tax=Romanomermis culicivorax TaxID=13658 RepID=A0A915IQD3_ROMCU